MTQLEGQAKQRYVSDLFARIAGRYDLMNDLITMGLHRRWKQRTAHLSSSGLRGRALDVATGTGDLALALARRPNVDHTVGIDLLPQMVNRAQAKAESAGLSDRATLMLGDALSLPFPDNSFACATSGFSLRNMFDLPQALSEMVRVVYPGGRVCTLELTPMGHGLKAAPLRLYFHRIVPLLGQLIAKDRSAYTYLPQSVDYFLEAGRLADLFREVGLEDVSYQRMGFGAVTLHIGIKPAA